MESLILLQTSQQSFSDAPLQDSHQVLCQVSPEEMYVIHQNGMIWIQTGQQLLTEPFDSRITCAYYLAESHQIFISTEIDLFLFSLQDKTLEHVGSIDSGILAVQWSPDQELVLFVTGNRTVLELNQNFEMISESPLDTNDFGEEKQVALGWGKKSTQFHGSEGKEAATKTLDSQGLSVFDDGQPRLSWRGDGNFYCVSFINLECTNRRILIFDRQGILQSTSEPVAFLEHALDWRPSGNLIASSQLLPHKHDIVFFERNGLRHGEFSIEKDAQVLELKWNMDSSCLCILLENTITKKQSLQLWTMKNYHWYLKQSLSLDHIVHFIWDLEEPLCLHLITMDGIYSTFLFAVDVITSPSCSPWNMAPVAVIDGHRVLLTPFKIQNVPPPMASWTMSMENPVSCVSFLAEEHGNDFCVTDNQSNVTLFSFKDGRKEPTFLNCFPLKRDHLLFRQVLWLRKHVLVAIAYHTLEKWDYLTVITLDDSLVCSSLHLESISETPLIRVYASSEGKCYVQDSFGNVYQVDLSLGQELSCRVELVASFPKACPWMGCFSIGIKDHCTIHLGLTSNNKLYANEQLLSSECTSFFIQTDFLILTTLSHTARFLSRRAKELKIVDKEPHPLDEDSRRVEIGSKIVVSTPGDVQLILQMPRGNLETIAPRALVLSQVRHSLDTLDYKSAFLHCRKHRIDMNLLIDHSFKSFFENTKLFVEQVQAPDYINLLLSSLRQEDVTRTLYSHGYARPDSDSVDSTIQDKVNAVCDAMRTTLETMDPSLYLHSILTAFAKKSPPDLESAMRRILQVKDQESQVAEEALKYLIFLADVDKLYDEALGMYDFSLVLMVAQHSQKDPREYLVFLNDLQKLPLYYQRFTIDDTLKRHEKALMNLFLAGEEYFEECLEYIVKHGLYKQSLDIFKSSIHLKRIQTLYADHLLQNKSFEEAAILYCLAGEYESALKAYKSNFQWENVFILASSQLEYSEESLKELAISISKELAEKKDFESASQVILEYGKDPKLSMEYLALGNDWERAMRIALAHDLQELIPNVILKNSNHMMEYWMEDIQEMLESFEKKRLKLGQVRQKKALKKLQRENNPHLDHVDIQSDTSSMATTFISGISSRMSSMSLSSAKSSKMQRKLERKKAAGKGEAFEESYLVQSLKKMMEKSNQMKTEIHSLLSFLCSCGQLHQASNLQVKFKTLLQQFDLFYSEIFPSASLEITLEQVKNGILKDPMAAIEAVLESQSQITPPVLSNMKWDMSFLD